MGVSARQWESLVKWSATAFVVGGIARLLNLALSNLGVFIEATSPEWSRDLTLLIAFGAAYIGLFGLYPWVADRAPRLSRAGAVLAGLAGVAILISVLGKYLHGASEPPGPLKVLPLIYLLGSPRSFLLFGIASWRTRLPSRTVGLLLLLAFAAFIVLVAGIFSQIGMLLRLSALIFAVAMLALGYVLHTGTTPFDTAESKREPTA